MKTIKTTFAICYILMAIKRVSYFLHGIVLNPELNSQEHGVKRKSISAQILTDVTGGLESLESPQLMSRRTEKGQP